MARRRESAPALVGGVPEPLTDHTHPAWADLAEFSRLCRTTGVLIALDDDAPWWARFAAYRRSWCLANGFAHPLYPENIDYQRAGAAGLDMHGTSRYRLRVSPQPEGRNHV